MTSSEARELAAWVTNIWTVEKPHGRISIPRGRCTFRYETFDYIGRVAPDTEFGLNNKGHFNDKDVRGVKAFSAYLVRFGKDGKRGSIYWDYETDEINLMSRHSTLWAGMQETQPPEELESYRQFDQQWETPFRRFCWLVGFKVEATFTEQAQWAQGLSSKDLERWKLNAIPAATA